ncbi:MAG: hypothetical protein BWY76_00579 [bacterium ADurb.Bin429]|nr:MAG: hypothetical protein BWY76_00579 [bacterium ADurb.Bin429]
MPNRAWTREELIIVFNLYCALSFGQYDARNTRVIQVAHAIGRTPNSVAMKLCNYASLDPAHQRRGVKGLANASRADKAIWSEMTANWTSAVEQIHRAEHDYAVPSSDEVEIEYPGGPTSIPRLTETRRGQGFFRRTVLSAYQYRCCISGMPLPELLVASHIVPWGQSEECRLNPCNGLCLSSIHDAAFDRGLITLDEEFKLVLSRRLREHFSNASIEAIFMRYEGFAIRLPDKFIPDQGFLAIHRESTFEQ